MSAVDRARRVLASVPARVVLPEGEDPRIVEAAAILRRSESVDAILLGDSARVESVATGLGLRRADLEILDPAARAAVANDYARLYQQARPGTRPADCSILQVSGLPASPFSSLRKLSSARDRSA